MLQDRKMMSSRREAWRRGSMEAGMLGGGVVWRCSDMGSELFLAKIK
jgi:hypothetical protein